ncbi:MAG: hypothetical protein IKC61_01845 [Clostridia bacterium]|nr:hypothetical protein [Clostridia bacterium]
MLREYFSEIIIIMTFAAILLGIAHPKLKGATSYSIGVLMICVILLPLVDIIRDFDTKSMFDSINMDLEYDITDDMIEASFEEGISEYIAQKYGVDKSCVSVMADGFDMERLRAERIYVTLSGRAVFLDYKKIEDEVRSEFTNGGECEVSLKIE